MFRTILAVLFAVCYLILGIPVLFVEWLIGKKNPHLRDISSLRMVQWAFRVIYRICGVKLTIIGQENVPKDTPVLYVANHNSYFDIIITYALCENLTPCRCQDHKDRKEGEGLLQGTRRSWDLENQGQSRRLPLLPATSHSCRAAGTGIHFHTKGPVRRLAPQSGL